MDSIKVVLVGDSGVGKTSILQRFAFNNFRQDTQSSIGGMLITKDLKIEEYNTTAKFFLWDTAGQEKYKSLASTYYHDAAATIIVYDITKLKTFNNVDRWLKEIKEKVSPECVIVLAGNKSDLIQMEEVELTSASEFAKTNGLKFNLTSAKNSTGITEMFTDLAKEIAMRIPKEKIKNSTKLTNKKHKKKSECCN